MKEFWNERFSTHAAIYGKEPNQFFKEFIDACNVPGSLLLPAEGQGRNAVYAAKKGWKVTAFDFSEAGRIEALQYAEREQVSIQYNLLDIATFKAAEQYDLVALIYVHQQPSIRKAFHHELTKAIRPGGNLIMEVYNKQQIHNNTGGPGDIEMLYDAAMMRSDFADLEMVQLEEIHTNISEGNFHSGMSDVLRMVAKKGSA